MTAHVVIKDRYRFLCDLDLTQVHPFGEGPVEGLRIVTRAQEHTIHEYAHAISAGLKLTREQRGSRMSRAVEWALKRKGHVSENEVRTIAAELTVLRALDATADEHEWLVHIEQQTAVTHLEERVLTKVYGRRYRVAEQDARRVIARIRAHANRRRKDKHEAHHRSSLREGLPEPG